MINIWQLYCYIWQCR